jgi:hypothetical protein
MNEYIPNRYKLLGKIGEGVHGIVLKALDTTQNNKVVAIKKVSLRTKFGGENGMVLKLKLSCHLWHFQEFHQTH